MSYLAVIRGFFLVLMSETTHTYVTHSYTAQTHLTHSKTCATHSYTYQNALTYLYTTHTPINYSHTTRTPPTHSIITHMIQRSITCHSHIFHLHKHQSTISTGRMLIRTFFRNKKYLFLNELEPDASTVESEINCLDIRV